MASLTIRVKKDQLEFVESQVAERGYTSVSSYMDALVRAERKRRAAERLAQMVRQAEASGPSTPMTKTDWEDLRREVSQELTKRKNKKKKPQSR